MIIGIGSDVIEIDRIQKVFEKREKMMREKVFTPTEWDYCFKFKEPFTHLAARFSAKEAYYKCIGRGVIRFNEIEVENDETGKPHINLYGETKKLWEEHGSPKIHVTLTHNKIVANAVVILEKLDK